MNCHKCGGLMVPDHDRESLTGERCINCGSPRGGVMAAPQQMDCKKPNCIDPKAEDSVYCIKHRDKKRAANQRAAAKRKGVSVAPADQNPHNRNPSAPRLKDATPRSPAKQGNGRPRNHVELTADYIRETIARLQGEIQHLEYIRETIAWLQGEIQQLEYIRETIARLQGEIQQLEQTLSVLDTLSVPPA